MIVRQYEPGDRDGLIGLWLACDLVRPWNDPGRDIERKLALGDGGLLVAVQDETVCGSVMAGYDGHRGWINYLATDPAMRRQGIGRVLVAEAEALLARRGCPKINLQIRSTNAQVADFYRRIGYADDDVISLGKRLVDDEANLAERH
jgi:ribosomal protein S18 acetylase RimI-like enzyme